MTMATSTVDHTTSWCPPLSLTPFSSSLTLPALNVSKFDACSTQQTSSLNLTILREIPTRNFKQDPPNAVINPLDNSDDDRTTTMTTTLPPTNSEGATAPLSYQSELAAIYAYNARMQQCDDYAQTNRQTTPPTDTELAALAAKLDRIANTTTPVPPSPATMNLPATAPMPVATAATLPYDDNDDDADDDDNGNHHPLSIVETFNLKTKMLCNLKMLVAELTEIVVLIVDATRPNKNSYLSGQQPALLIPATTLTTIRPATAFTFTEHPSNTQIKPWPPHHVASSNKLASRPHKKHIPAKPPFNCGRPTCHLVKTRKDSLRPP